MLINKLAQHKYSLQVCNCLRNKERPILSNYVTNRKPLKDLIESCWHHNPKCRPSSSKILTTLNRISFPDNLTDLLASSQQTFNTEVYTNGNFKIDEDDEIQPRKPLSYRRSMSVPLAAPPPPPLPPQTNMTSKIFVKSPPKMIERQIERGFPISCDDICRQRQMLKRCQSMTSSRQKVNSTDDLTSIMKRVMDKRREESGWILGDETSSEGQSRSSSRISTSQTIIHNWPREKSSL